MTMVPMLAQTPDGPMSVVVDVDLPDEEMCTAQDGIAACTLPAAHKGAWHIATTRTKVVHVWPVKPS